MRALELDLIEREVGKAREHLGLRLARQIASLGVLAVGLRRGAREHYASAFERIAGLALIE
jgi:hypothetical protein